MNPAQSSLFSIPSALIHARSTLTLPETANCNMASFLEVLATIVYGCFVLGIRALVSQVRKRVGFGYAVVIRAVHLALEAAEGVPLSIQHCYLRQGKRCVRICRRLTKPYHLKIHGCLTAVLHSRCISKKYKHFANKLAGSLHNILDIPERLIIWLVCCLCGWNKFLWTRVSCVCTIVVTACGGFTHIGHDTLRWSLLKVQSWACIFSSLVKSVAQLYYRTGKCTAGQQVGMCLSCSSTHSCRQSSSCFLVLNIITLQEQY